MRTVITFMFLCALVFGADIKPTSIIKLDAAAIDMATKDKKIYVCSAKGDVYEIVKSHKKLYSLPYFTTPYGERRAQKALSLGVSQGAKTVVIAAEDGHLYIGKGASLVKTGFFADSVIKKVEPINDNLIMVAMIGGQVALFDALNNKTVYVSQISSSPLSDMALSADKKSAAVVGEAGVLYMVDVTSGKIRAAYKNVNLDNIYKVDYQNGMIITAGQDRKATLVSEKGVIKAKFDGDFLIYAAALSPSAAKAAVAINEQNEIAIFDTSTRSHIATAKGHNATLNRILFVDERVMASCADENRILIWRIK